MEYVLTTSSSISCDHPPSGGGSATQTPAQNVLKVDGNSVLVGDLTNSSINSLECALLPPPPATNKKCSKILAQTQGFSQVLMVEGSPALLENSSGTTDGLPAPQTWSAKNAEQDVLRAD
jgi:hypothetical protein